VTTIIEDDLTIRPALKVAVGESLVAGVKEFCCLESRAPVPIFAEI
jgi:hypothetical protein